MSKHKPWNLEIYRGFDSDFKEDQLLLNQPIREFLDSEDKFFLVGAKGLGKTLFLRYKSNLYHNRYGSSFQFNVSQTELTENLNIHAFAFSKEDLLRFRDEKIWRLIWELALWIMVFRLKDAPINPRLDKMIHSSKELSNILSHLLNHRNKIDQYHAFVGEFQEQKSKIQSAVALFIDDVDQALHALLNAPHHTDTYFEDEQSPSVEVWVNAQMGLVGAVYNLSRQNAHIKIYATIRKEAFEAYQGQMRINYRQHICTLQYTKGEIKEIFEKNIQLIEPADLQDRFANAPIGRFLGFDEFPHRFAVGPDDKRRVEEAFNFIYRHTYGRPREIVLIGYELNVLVSTLMYRGLNEETRYSEVRVLVNRVSNELLQQYKQEVIPYWDEVRLQHFISSVRSNVIAKEDFRLFDQDLLRQYYNLGLIGYARPANHSGLLRQVFNPPATYNYRRYQPLPATDYLLIHSTMDNLLLEQHTYGGFHNPYNIIGDGYDFYPRMDNSIHQLEYYLPQDILGNRMNAPSESSGHDFPMEEMYRNFFAFEKAVRRHERFQMHWKIAELVMGLLGRICYCNRLEKQFKTGYYAAKKAQYLTELDQHHYARQYNAEMADTSSEPAFDRFLDKLIGRYITLGCYLVLDLRIEWIHALLTRGRFDFTPNEASKDTALSYLSRGFFIRDLKRDEPRNPVKPEQRQCKQRIFTHLSTCEQDSLRAFIRNASDEVSFLGWIEDPAHEKWLHEEVLARMWHPE